MVTKSFSLFGREIWRAERDRSGQFFYTLLGGNSFDDNGKYLELYFKNPVLNTIVNLRSELYSQMKIQHFDKNDKVIESSPYVNLLYNPNYFQSKEDFFYQQMVFLSTSGNNYIYQKKAFANELPKAIYNLIPSEIDLNDIQKLNKFLVTKQDINAFNNRKIKYKLDGQTYDLYLTDILPLYDLANGLKDNTFMQSPSRVKAIYKVLCNIDENLASKNINLKMSQKYLSKNESTGNEAQIKEDDRKNIDKAIYNKSLILTNANISVQHLVTDMKKLFLDEQFADDANKCLLAFGLNKDVLNYFAKDSTFENQEKGTIKYIQNSIQSTADNTMNSLSSQWGLLDKGERLKASYDHLAVMQSIVVDKINSFKAMQEAIKLGLENTTITTAEAVKMSNEFKMKLGL
jgi:hypothetical protein